MLKHALLAAALTFALGSPAVFAQTSQNLSGSTTLDVSHVTSEADLAKQLAKMGYTNIHLTRVGPTEADPRPDLEDTGKNGTRRQNSANVPVRPGWNGTAVHNGKRVNILVDEAGHMTTK